MEERMKSHLAKVSLALLSAGFLLGCQEQGSDPVGPEGLAPQFAKDKGCPGSAHPSCKPAEDPVDDTEVTWSFADARVDGEPSFVENSPNTLQSLPGCFGFPGAQPSKPSVEWNDQPDGEDEGSTNGCAQVTTTGTDAALPVTLTNDALLIVATKRGSPKFTIQFQIQDVGGSTGTQYRTDKFFINSPKFTGAGFTLHVHSTVDIYRLKGHTGGPKVQNVGTIYIDDIVYR